MDTVQIWRSPLSRVREEDAQKDTWPRMCGRTMRVRWAGAYKMNRKSSIRTLIASLHPMGRQGGTEREPGSVWWGKVGFWLKCDVKMRHYFVPKGSGGKSKNATLTQRRKMAQQHGSKGARCKKQKKERTNSKNLSENICQRAGTPSGPVLCDFCLVAGSVFPISHPSTAAKVSVLLRRVGKRPPAKGTRSAGIPFSIFMCIFFYFWLRFRLPWRGVAWKYAFFVCES